jgi:hypothetical protein
VDQTKRMARRAGLLYVLACIPAPFALIYVPRTLVVAGDPTATAERVRSSEVLLRMGIAGELINSIVVIFAVLAFYRLFKTVSETHALAMAALYLVSIPISLLNVLNEIAALVFARGSGFLSVFDQRQLDALAYLFLHLHSQGFVVAGLFWGLWLFPFGMLVIRSRFIPRALGVCQMIAGVGYVANSSTSLLLPQYAPLVSQVAIVLFFGEFPIVVWLLIWGAKTQPSTLRHQ